MRIDDENKVVVPKRIAKWIEQQKQSEEIDYSKGEALKDTIHFTIYGLWANYPETNSDTKLRVPVLEWLGDDRGNYFKLVDAVRYGYEIQVEQKYYWRKKKEHLAWFEEGKYLQKRGDNLYLARSRYDIAKGPVNTFKCFTEQQARELLKDDFDKFEKVEINDV